MMVLSNVEGINNLRLIEKKFTYFSKSYVSGCRIKPVLNLIGGIRHDGLKLSNFLNCDTAACAGMTHW
jgi:hypothetical protein